MANTLSIAIPQPQVDYIDARVARGEYNNRSEYIRDLVRRDQHEEARNRLRTLIEEGAASGEATPWTANDSDELDAIANGSVK